MLIAALTFLLLFSDSAATVVVQSSQKLFRSAVCLSSAPNGLLFVVDQKIHSVHQLSSGDSITRTIGGQGWGSTEFDVPSDVTSSFLLDVFVVDRNNRRIQRFDKQFNYVQTYDERSLSQSVDRFQPRACAVSLLGELFIVEMDGRRIVKLSSRGKYLAEFGAHSTVSAGVLRQPIDIAVSSSNEVFVLDQNRLLVYDTFGNYLKQIALSDSSVWQSVTSSDQFIVITSPRLIEIVSSDNTARTSITQSNIINFPSNIEFVDAAIVRGKLTILTKKTLYRCSLRW